MARRPAIPVARVVALSGLGLVAGASARALFKRRPADGGFSLVDWDLVRSRAYARTGERGRLRDDASQAAVYDRIARELALPMAEVLGDVPIHFPAFAAVDRRGFIDRNLVIARALVDPVDRYRAGMPHSRASELSRHLLSRYMGEMFGFLSHRVLGQYDPVLQLEPAMVNASTPTSLFLVESNLEVFERTLRAPSLALRRWLILHELTHAWQFESHLWLRDYLAGEMRHIIDSALPVDAAGAPALPGAGTIVKRLPDAVQRQLANLGRIQAVMSILEGYSNFVMHRVGARHLEHFEQLELAFAQRRRQRSVLERMVMTLTGMRLKMRQYELGENFATEVDACAGIATLNRIWDGPESLPTLAELRSPGLWLERVS